MNIIFRAIDKKDAKAVVDLMVKIDSQTDFLRYEPGERNTTPQRIAEIAKSIDEVMFVAQVDESLVGYLLISSNNYSKKKHCMDYVLAVLDEYQRKGIGSKLIHKAEEWGKKNLKHRIEITVNTRNKNAFKLYKKLGYEVEGYKRHASFINGKYNDEYLMSKLI